MKLTKNFNKKEFDCKCGCEMPSSVFYEIEELANELQIIRDSFNAPIQINSAYRCPSHNKAIGGVSNSQHVLGKASDIVIKGYTPDEVADQLEVMLEDECLFPFHLGGIGKYNTFTHIDIRPKKARWDNRTL
tara:strand:- start:3364 stop:3759 length:396 start_codon:yes stop_codon:yes gene_type:complete